MHKDITQKRKKYIVIFTDSLQEGGLQKAAALTSLALHQLNYEIFFILSKNISADYEYYGIIVYNNDNEINKKIDDILKNAFLLLDYRWKNPCPKILKYAMSKYSNKYIPVIHNTITCSAYIDACFDENLKLEDYPSIVCVSESVRLAVQSRYGHYLNNISVIYNTFKQSSHKYKKKPTNEKYFLFVGRLHATEHKGIDTLLQAWALTQCKNTHKLFFIGYGNFESHINELIKNLHIDNSIVTIEFSKNIEEWMCHAAALILPSRWEGFGLVLVESLACGVPCITTRCGSTEEIIKHGINGLTVNIDDIPSLASSIDNIAKNKYLRARLARNSLNSIKCFNFQNHILAWSALLHNVENKFLKSQKLHTQIYSLPAIPDIGMGSFFERALWKVAPKRAAVYALRRSHCFDINYYKAMYPDVAKAGVDPVLHYVYFGAKEGRNPAPWFNTSLYVADNPDVIAAGVNPFYHYIRYGHAENRRPAV